MVTMEFKTPVSAVRIHDDYLESSAGEIVLQVSNIVARSYKRRMQQSDGGAIAAMNAAGRREEI